MGKGETIPGMLEGVPWGQPSRLGFVPGVKPGKHSQSTNKPAKGQLEGYLELLTPCHNHVPQFPLGKRSIFPLVLVP